MALQKDYINELGQTIADCYWKIGVDDGIVGGKYEFTGKLYCYANKTDADANQNELGVYEFGFVLDMGRLANVIEQAYEEVKTYEDFGEAQDV